MVLEKYEMCQAVFSFKRSTIMRAPMCALNEKGRKKGGGGGRAEMGKEERRSGGDKGEARILNKRKL